MSPTTIVWTLRIGMVAFALLAVLAPSAPASAHTELVSSTPPAGAHLTALPDEIAFEFNQDIAGEFAAVTLTPPGGAPVPLDVTVDGPRVTALVPAELAEDPTGGGWRVAYRVTSADGHPIDGQVDFDVRQRVAPSAPAPTDAATPRAQADAAEALDMDHQTQPTSSEDGTGSPWTSTIVIGLIAATLTVAILVLLRRRSEKE